MSEPTVHTSTSTLRSKTDYFALDTAFGGSAGSPKLKVVASAENPSIQSTAGQNTYGDSVVVDAYGKAYAPSSEYELVAAVSNQVITLGSITTNTIDGTANTPVCLGSLSISTQTGSVPKISASGQAVPAGMTTPVRTYKLPAITLSTRHRAQDIFAHPLFKILKGQNAASPAYDYGLSSANANFPIEFTLAQPQGDLVNYDLHGGTMTVDYTLNWYSATAPTIGLNTDDWTGGVMPITIDDDNVFNAPMTLTTPQSRSDPENGYTQYTFQISIPLVGKDYSS